MKKKISVAALIMSGCVMMVFAATKADPCTEKHKSCSDSCAITQSQALLRGVDSAGDAVAVAADPDRSRTPGVSR